MKRTANLLLIFLLPLIISGQTARVAPNRPLIIQNATVINMQSARPRSKMTILISDNRITQISKKINLPKNAEIVNAKGKFLIPGLWDMHVHVDDAGSWMFPLFIANGVVGVRDMGSNLKQISLWREMRKSGKLMPQIVAAGPIVSGKIGDNDPRLIAVENRREAIAVVANLSSRNVDFIKVHDWVSRDTYLGLIEETRRKNLPLTGHQPVSMTAEEISNLGQKSVEHFGNAWGGLLIDCSRRETELRKKAQSLIPHTFPEFNPPKLLEKLGNDWEKILAESYSPAKCESLARVFKRNKTWFDPTIYGFAYAWTFVKEKEIAADPRLKYMPLETQNAAREAAKSVNDTINAEKEKVQKAFYQKQLNIVRAMNRTRVGILAGTDALPFPPIYPGFSLHDELEKLVEAGLSPFEALQAATINPAKFFGRENEFGTIEKGKIADLVLLDANPLENISNTRKINSVILNGRFLNRGSLDEILADVERINSK